MAQHNQNAIVSMYPPPPKRFYHNCATNRPTPPPPPTAGTYRMFGRVYTTEDVQPTLEEAGRRRLFDPARPPLAELRRLNTRLLHLYLRLVDALCTPAAVSPDFAAGPNDVLAVEIGDVLINMQFLLNSMRPTQAAHDLRALLERQTAARRDMVDRLRAAERKSWDLIAEAADRLAEPADALPPDSAAAAAIARAAVAAAPAARRPSHPATPAAADPADPSYAGNPADPFLPGVGVGAARAAEPLGGTGVGASVADDRVGALADGDGENCHDDDEEGLIPQPPRPPPEQLAVQLAHIVHDPSL